MSYMNIAVVEKEYKMTINGLYSNTGGVTGAILDQVKHLCAFT